MSEDISFKLQHNVNWPDHWVIKTNIKVAVMERFEDMLLLNLSSFQIITALKTFLTDVNLEQSYFNIISVYNFVIKNARM